MSIRLMTVDTTRQARGSLVGREQAPRRSGSRADDRAPAATSWKIEVRQAERREERVELGRRAERVADDDRSDVAEDPRDEERARDDQPGAGQGPAGAHGVGVATRPRDGPPDRRPGADRATTWV